jgi:glycosyltransferase involved in cell wall biosynthesis
MLSTVSKKLVIVVPALNEEADIENTIRELLPVVRGTEIPFEMIAINDGSSDRTGAIIDRLAAEIPELRAIHHEHRKGVGASFAQVLQSTEAPYVTLIPGDNAFCAASLAPVFALVGQYDLVISYRANREARTFRRALMTRLMCRSLNLLFGLDLRDYSSVVVYPVVRLRELHLASKGFAYQTEAVISLAKSGCRVKQVLVNLNTEVPGRSRAFNLKVMWLFALTAMRLFYRFQLSGRRYLASAKD